MIKRHVFSSAIIVTGKEKTGKRRAPGMIYASKGPRGPFPPITFTFQLSHLPIVQSIVNSFVAYSIIFILRQESSGIVWAKFPKCLKELIFGLLGRQDGAMPPPCTIDKWTSPEVLSKNTTPTSLVRTKNMKEPSLIQSKYLS